MEKKKQEKLEAELRRIKKVAEIVTRAIERDEVDFEMPLLGPAMTLAGITLGIGRGERDQVFAAIYAGLVATGAAPSMEEMRKRMREDPGRIANLIAALTGAQVVTADQVPTPKRRKNPWLEG
jgi:hypothetical protein